MKHTHRYVNVIIFSLSFLFSHLLYIYIDEPIVVRRHAHTAGDAEPLRQSRAMSSTSMAATGSR